MHLRESQRSLVAILVAMQWANEDVFNSGSKTCNAAFIGRERAGGDMWQRN